MIRMWSDYIASKLWSIAECSTVAPRLELLPCQLPVVESEEMTNFFSSSASAHSKIGPTASQKALLAKKRLSLTDHVGAVSQQAMQKIINRKSLNSNEMSMIGYIETDDVKTDQSGNDPRRMNKMKGVSEQKTY